MNRLDLTYIERELRKRNRFPYKWSRKQNDEWDRYTNFIYQSHSWEALIRKVSIVAENKELDEHQVFQYASNRWYNFWSAKAVEEIFKGLDGIEPVNDIKDKEKDFYLYAIPFDHKTSVYPKQFGQSFDYARDHKPELIKWLYKNQSAQNRHHLKNRLFLVVYDENGEHWKLKAEITLLKKEIAKYVESFSREKLISINFANGQSALSDIIWIYK